MNNAIDTAATAPLQIAAVLPYLRHDRHGRCLGQATKVVFTSG